MRGSTPKDQRLLHIIEQLNESGKVKVNVLAKKLGVTERTIRNDLSLLEKNGICSIHYGGAEILGPISQHIFQLSGLKNIINSLSIYQDTQELSMMTNHNKPEVFVLGSFNVDIVSEVVTFPKSGQTVRGKSTHFYAGGKGANQATAAANVNNHVHFTAKVGRDEFYEMAKTYLQSTKINSLSLFEHLSVHTGNAIIIVNTENAENFITINPGANETLTRSEIDSQLDFLKKGRVFLTQLENNFEMTEYALTKAAEFNLQVILNPAPYLPEVRSVLSKIDILTPNETEASDLTGIVVEDINTAKQAALKIHQMGVKKIIITLSHQGVLFFDGNEYLHFPAYKAIPIDTSGAGDAFNGALAGALANGCDIHYAIQYANAFASLAVERKGASNMPSHDWVLNRIQSEPLYRMQRV
ncbi:PfkB family carbohydrate kinase [Thorsellia kenyensis]|uniref:Ribokinase n=1 Tax=Thorsellia kenyensis TaxID=1549888 RepID=A0ABV6CC27_9GAMM